MFANVILYQHGNNCPVYSIYLDFDGARERIRPDHDVLLASVHYVVRVVVGIFRRGQGPPHRLLVLHNTRLRGAWDKRGGWVHGWEREALGK